MSKKGIGIGALLLAAGALAWALWPRKSAPPPQNTPSSTTAAPGISGTVRDASTGLPIAGAMVRVGTLFAGETDSQGKFSITNIPPATYLVTAWATGYETATVGEVTVRAGESLTLPIALTPSSTPTPTDSIVPSQLTSVWEHIGDEITTAHKVVGGYLVMLMVVRLPSLPQEPSPFWRRPFASLRTLG